MSEQSEIPNPTSTGESPPAAQPAAHTARKSKVWHTTVSQEIRINMVKKM